eukprot:scaffold160860_cov28-Tisochrysis_lutea.AAC.2
MRGPAVAGATRDALVRGLTSVQAHLPMKACARQRRVRRRCASSQATPHLGGELMQLLIFGWQLRHFERVRPSQSWVRGIVEPKRRRKRRTPSDQGGRISR